MSSWRGLPRAGHVCSSAVLRRGDSLLSVCGRASSSEGQRLAWQVTAWLCAAEDRAGTELEALLIPMEPGSQEPSRELVGLDRSIVCLHMGPQSSVAVRDSEGTLAMSHAQPGLVGWGSGFECWSSSAALLSTLLLPYYRSPGCFLCALWLRDFTAAVCCQNAKGK